MTNLKLHIFPIILMLLWMIGCHPESYNSSLGDFSHQILEEEEIPYFVHTPEFRIQVKEAYEELYGLQEIDFRKKGEPEWLGHCLTKDLLRGGNKKSGDKVSWNGKTFCVPW